ncbi:MAG: hypothetical protein IKL20_05800 [Alistipes sp.]|nr:hypothetical protein [Alistipes sp.]
MKNRVLALLIVAISTVLFSGCIDMGNKNSDIFMLDEDTSLGYNMYKNYKYGYCYSYPTFLEVPMMRSGDDEKQLFVSKDGRIEVAASARFNHGGRTEKSLFDEEKYFLERDGNRITYEFSKNGMVVFSGFTPENKIFYQKIAVCNLYSPQYRDTRSVIARVDVVWENDDRYRGEEIVELLKKFPFEKR